MLYQTTCNEHQLALLSTELILIRIFVVNGGENKNEYGSEAIHHITLQRATEERFRNIAKVKKATRMIDVSGRRKRIRI